MQKYKYVYMPSHPRAMSNGCIYEHILIAEQKLGRQLKDGECVHHIDENKRNNDPNNLMVFDSTSSHSGFHNGNKLIKLEDGTYSALKERSNICPICGKHKSIGSKICSECSYKNKIEHIPQKDELLNYLINNNANKSRVAKIYNVSQTTIRHWCKRYGIRDGIYNTNMSKPTKERK